MTRRARLFVLLFVCFAIAIPSMAQSTFHFDKTGYTTHEGDGLFQVRIIRDGDTSGPATVNIQEACCASPIANYGFDYWLVGQQFSSFATVAFLAGDTFKDVTYVVNDDDFAEGTEFAMLSLSGNGVTAPSTTTVAIVDNDATTSSSLSRVLRLSWTSPETAICPRPARWVISRVTARHAPGPITF